MTAELTDDDSGKTVVRGTERVGVVTDVHANQGRAEVAPDWDHVTDDLAAALDWERDGTDQPLSESQVTAVQNGEVRLREDL